MERGIAEQVSEEWAAPIIPIIPLRTILKVGHEESVA
jgi:hypothetical protein